ncbi:MAG: ribonuclease H-like domain-containing protein [Candidatus Rokubacteria bacterium]|nr:ribonuclease H-like domain-containing protein [Candidatus Rokubacteria bacterium]MBI3827010.1 ribonuclease H-like domain-containing protein [Candidatus Rokubacteria bacterium]
MLSPPDAGPRAATLADLRRVIRRIESRNPFRRHAEAPEVALGGEVVENADGRLLVVRREFPLDHRHGRIALAEALAVPPQTLGLLGRSIDGPVAGDRLVFLDTETTGLAGGTGTYAFLVGVGCVEDDRFVVAQYFMRDLDEEPALLTALAPVLEGATALVTFNGGGFDVPLLETRFVLARRRWRADVGHLDLLRPARRVWRAGLADCRLGTLEREVLGVERDGDVPGALIPSLYFDFLRRKNPARLGPVFGHNRDDVLSLVALLGWFGRALAGDAADLTPEQLAGLGRLLEAVDADRSADYYRAALAAGLEGMEGLRVQLRLAGWEKRRARWDVACALWEAATASRIFDLRPWEELAKFHEHRQRDARAALEVVSRALDAAATLGLAGRARGALAHRLARLERRARARGVPAS